MASSSGDVSTKKSGLIDFPQHLRTFIQRMRDNDSSHDVVFVVENERFPAHRCLMEATSPVLRKMLTNGMKETNEREVVLKEVNVKAWKAVLDYMYTAKMELPNAEDAVQYLACAERFQIEELEGVISDYIERELDTSNCSEILGTVDCLHSTKLRAAAMKTIVDNFDEVLYKEGFALLPFELFQEVISCDKLVVRSELDVFIAVVRWCMRRINCGVSEEPKDGTAKDANEVLARKVLSLFVEYEFVEPSLTKSRPLLFGFDGLVESNTNEHAELNVLFDCVDINKLSVDDLRRVSGLCRELCKEARTNFAIEMTHVSKFSERTVDKLVQLHNGVPNIPVALYERIPHGRNDVLFTFSHRFHNVQVLRGWNATTGYQVSPKFADQFGKSKWSLRVYFRGYNEEVRDKYASCFLNRTAEGSATEENRTFGRQIFMDFGNICDEPKPKVYSDCYELDNTRKYSDGQGWGTFKFAPSSAFSGKDTVTVGVIIYFKSSGSV